MAQARQVNTPSLRLTIRTDIIDREFFSAQGAVAIMAKRAADAVHTAAKGFIGTEYSGSWNNNRGGTPLSQSGRVVRARIGGPNYEVVFKHRAAVIHHVGAGAHQYSPRVSTNSKGGLYSNIWRGEDDGGPNTPYFFPATTSFVHPGHAANPYLTKAGRQVGLRVSQTPGGSTGARPGIARIPRGFV